MTANPSIQFLGHAGLLIRHAGVSLLCDPWLSETGAFLRSWHQYPPNDLIEREALYDADYIYLSHRHFDHFDREFLARFPKTKVTVIIAEYVTHSFAREIAELGFPRIITLSDWRALRLADDFAITLVRDSTLYKTDSIALVEAGGTTIMNKNDCHLSEAEFARFRDRGIDILFAQFSGAMWYPAAYVYPEIRQTEITANIRKSLIKMFIDLANGVGARHVVHCAGPPCFLEPQTFPLNFSGNGIFFDQSDAFAEIGARIEGDIHLVLPGDVLSVDRKHKISVARERDFDFSQKEAILRRYQERRQPAIDEYLSELRPLAPNGLGLFARFLTGLFSSNSAVRDRIDALVKFTVTGLNGGSVFVDTRGRRFTVSEGCAARPSYEFLIDSRVARLLAERDETWEDVFLSMRFRARRDPDFYNWPLFAILQYGHDPKLIAQVETMLASGGRDTITVQDEGRSYQIQRYCPHAGEDLTNAKIVDGKVICPRHQWAFDLRCGGQCDKTSSVSLKLTAIEAPIEKEKEVTEVA